MQRSTPTPRVTMPALLTPERRGAGLDHPVLATLPESEYLKALFVRSL